MKIRLAIADDDELIRESLNIILSKDEDIEIVGLAKNGRELLNLLLNERVDVALVDVRMPELNGVEATLEITKRVDTKVLILSTFDEDEYINLAFKNGAKGYLLKNTNPRKIIEAIKMVHSGSGVIQEEVLEKIKNTLNFGKDESKIDKSLFTERELEIMEAIAEGLSNKEISKKLFISEGTVKNYITTIFQKTNLSHRTQIAIYYLKGGIKSWYLRIKLLN